jgi:hypothetical protein
MGDKYVLRSMLMPNSVTLRRNASSFPGVPPPLVQRSYLIECFEQRSADFEPAPSAKRARQPFAPVDGC